MNLAYFLRNELMQKATFDDRYEILPGEQKANTLTNGLLSERPDLLFHVVERITNVGHCFLALNLFPIKMEKRPEKIGKTGKKLYLFKVGI